MKEDIYHGMKYSQGQLQPVRDSLTVEEALQIIINDKPFTVTMRTPGDDPELIRGLLYSEDVLTAPNFELKPEMSRELSKTAQTTARLNIPSELLRPGHQAERSITSVSSCGVCGKTELYQDEGAACLNLSDEKLHLPRLQEMFRKMREHQDTFARSGGSHAAAAFDLAGNLLTVKEDIGRHNAVDKVIGSLIMEQKLPEAKCLLVSGRISYEIVQKCSKAGMPFLAAVSAPSTLAVQMAQDQGMSLMAFCREGRATIYSHPENVNSGSEIDALQKS